MRSHHGCSWERERRWAHASATSSWRANIDAIRPGDLVVSVPSPPALPSSMVIGSVRSSDAAVACFERDPRKPLVVTIHVKAALLPEEINDVFIVAGGPDR